MDPKLDSNNFNRGSDAYCDDLHWKLENVTLKFMTYNLRKKYFFYYSRTHVIGTLRDNDICSNYMSFRVIGS